LPRTGLFFLVGPNGSGKSTFFEILSGFASFEGEYQLGGVTIEGAKDAPFLRKAVGYISLHSPLVSSFSVAENVFFPYRDEDQGRLEEVLAEVGLLPLLRQKANVLSEGEKRRLLLAIELYGGKDVILADEPTSSLDPKSAGKVLACLGKASADHLVIVSTNEEIPDTLKKEAGVLAIQGQTLIVVSRPVPASSIFLERSGSVASSPWQCFARVFRGRRSLVFLSSLFALLSLCLLSSFALPSYGNTLEGEETFRFLSAKQNYDFISFDQTDESCEPSRDLKQEPEYFLLVEGVPNLFLGTRDYPTSDIISELDNGIINLSFLSLSRLNALTLAQGRYPEKDGEFLISSFQAQYLVESGYYSSFEELTQKTFVVSYENQGTSEPFQVVGTYQSAPDDIRKIAAQINGMVSEEDQAHFRYAIAGGGISLLTDRIREENPYFGTDFVFTDTLTCDEVRGYTLYSEVFNDYDSFVSRGMLGKEEQAESAVWVPYCLLLVAFLSFCTAVFFFLFLRRPLEFLAYHTSAGFWVSALFVATYFLAFSIIPLLLSWPVGILGGLIVSQKTLAAHFVFDGVVNLYSFSTLYYSTMGSAALIGVGSCLFLAFLFWLRFRRERRRK
jgi:ABC-type lipoprotein export system ATPase subunit